MATEQSKPKTAGPTQTFVPIKEIRNGVVVLENNSLCIILMGSSLNFALKSQSEQEAILFQFQNFLNSLDFSVQFFLESRRLDIRPYIALLEEQSKGQSIELMKIQINEYIEFIKKFTESINIMTKSFFVVIPYTPPIVSFEKGSAYSNIFSKVLSKREAFQEKKKSGLEIFEENRTQLEQRTAIVEQGLARTGIRVAPLNTEELVELYYKIFNPGEQEKPMPLNQ